MAVTPPVWTFVLCSLAGTVLGELTNADDRVVTTPLNRVPTASFKLPLAHRLANTLVTTDTILKCYRNDGTTKRLMFCGPVITTEEQAEADVQSIAVTAAGPYWRLTKRLLGTDKTGISFGTTGSLMEITTIAQNAFNAVNGVEYTGISIGTVTPNSPANNTKVGPLYLKNLAELLAELSASVNSFDFEVVPSEPTNIGQAWPKIGTLNIIPYIGVSKPSVIFEYGSGSANLVGYQRSVGRDGMLTKGYCTAPGWPDGTALDLRVIESGNRASRGLFEDVITDGGVSDDNVRDAMLNEHMYYRSTPRQLVTVTTAPNRRPWAGTDFNVGDSVRARGVVRGSLRFDAMFRIWGATYNVDKNGNEQVTLEMVMP